MVLFFPKRPEVPKRVQAQPGSRCGLLEGDGGRQGDRGSETVGDQEGLGFLRRQSPQGRENQLDHARVPPRRRRSLRPQQEQPQGTYPPEQNIIQIGIR